ncbi:MAG: polysaccharide pyruvyl transferase family protein [Alphaproteobacteria bacterium]|nr:polysaccharide pyruvyl transferase family protein [Alphaproteobacteria bacterium]
MITASLEVLENLAPDLAVDMFCESRAADIVRAKGFNPIIMPALPDFPAAMAKLFDDTPYMAMISLGADIMDGYYSHVAATRILIAADLAEKSGVPATILGCSFNDTPVSLLAEVYRRLDPGVALNMRDEISLERIRAFAPVTPNLVADSAFNLKPGKVNPATQDWVDDQRAHGRTIVGMNVHPMLIKGATPEQVEQIITTTTTALQAASATHPEVSWLMLPHDYRGADGDARCLKPVYDGLVAAGGIETHFLDGEHRAADLKAMAGLTDGVVTGRMHLAIAALGMGVPVLSLTYQDKFEGLYRHFDLPSSLLLPPAIFDQGPALGQAISAFAADLPALTATVARAKPKVLALARDNYARYLDGDAAA